MIYERSVTSQFGEDGILEHLLQFVPEHNSTFVEFGWGLGKHTTCTNLMVEHGFTGSGVDVRGPKRTPHPNLTHHVKKITLDNVDFIISLEGVEPTVLSMDIDGYDWFIMNELINKNYRPHIICHEYNRCLGPHLSVSCKYEGVVYDKRWKHGASLTAFKKILEPHYNFVTVGSTGNNAFWLRSDHDHDHDMETTDFNPYRGTFFSLEEILKDNCWIKI